jgi:hypothetical protein
MPSSLQSLITWRPLAPASGAKTAAAKAAATRMSALLAFAAMTSWGA